MAYLYEALYKEAFVGRIRYYFSNNGCPIVMAQALNEMGYVVDAIGNDDIDFKIKDRYDLVILHNPGLIGLWKKKLPKGTPIVYFEVVAYWREVLKKMQSRFEVFNQKYNLQISSEDFDGYKSIAQNGEEYDRNILLADSRIVLGDQLTQSFAKFPKTFFTTSVCLPDKNFNKDLSPKNLEQGRKNFVFFGGSTHNFRKGLHLLFEAFINSPYNLYVCSSVNEILYKVFNLEKQSNIHLLGYQKQGSKKFYELINKCDFVIHPSCAEGIPGGVLDTVKYGLIPIVSRECNIVNAGKLGILLENSSPEEIKQAVNFVASQSTAWLQEHSQLCITEGKTTYALEAFKNDFKSAIKKTIV
jgi:glycosyltransferase involved in cell wall biosynthesis